MFFIYLGYLALRRSFDDPELRARRSAVLGVIAVLQIPIVHFSVTWWRGLHQPPTVLRPDNPQIDSPLLFALLMGVAAFTVLFAALVSRRSNLAALQDAAGEAELADPTAGAAITAPTVGGPS
jgi:heme exporter protein C